MPRVKLTTDQGPVTVELFENEAPETVGNFISLVEKGYYDGLVFHRVMEAFMAQGGCPDGNGGGGPGYNIYCECVNDNHRNHFAGSLSMAKQQPRNTGGSQFFLTFVPTTHLNGQHTVFGRVIEGMDVLPKIIKRTPDSAPPTPDPTVILKAEVVRKRDHEYRPNKVK
ncbi:MAG: peptidylprolyl isomerase [Planctomycetota bacterium]